MLELFRNKGFSIFITQNKSKLIFYAFEYHFQINAVMNPKTELQETMKQQVTQDFMVAFTL